MEVTLKYVIVVLVGLCAPVMCQWKSPARAAPPKTVQVNVNAGPRGRAAARARARAPAPAPAPPPAPAPAPAPYAMPQSPLGLNPIVSAPLGAPVAPAPAVNPLTNPFFAGAFDPSFVDEVMSDRPCGISRAGAMGGAGMWALEGGAMMFTCQCHMFNGENFEMGNVDNSPQAQRDCMTQVTGVFCCLH